MPVPASASIGLHRCRSGEESLFVTDGEFRLNPHGHTTDSDGAHTLEELAGFAETHGVNLAVTEHNVPPRTPKGGRWSPGLMAGIEVFTRRPGVDVVVLGTLDGVRKLFEDLVRPALRGGSNFKFRPTGLPIQALLEAVPHYDAWCIHPHYATVEGLSMLPPDQQRQALETARDRTFIEVSAMMTRHANALALALAAEWELPVLACGDTHREERQHVGTYSAVTHDEVADPASGPLPLRVLQALHARTDRSRDRLHAPGAAGLLRVGAQVVINNGAGAISAYVAKAIGRRLGVWPAARETSIPKRGQAASS